jgi:hypothetical protein
MSIFALLAATSSRADEAMPARPNFNRYETMLQHSPFAVASAVAPPAATPNFAKDLYVANAGHLPDGDMVTIASTSDKNFREYLTTKGPVDGYSIASIEWSEKVGATKVTISKDGQFATLGFNEALLNQLPLPNLPGQAQPPPQPGVPNRPNRPPTAGAGAAIPVPTPAMPKPARTPHVRPTIQRYPTPRPGA